VRSKQKFSYAFLSAFRNEILRCVQNRKHKKALMQNSARYLRKQFDFLEYFAEFCINAFLWLILSNF